MKCLGTDSISYLLILLMVFCFISPVYADCDAWFYSSSNEPVANVTVTFRNISNNVTLSVNTSGSSGRAYHVGNCINISISAKYPSSGYSASLSNASVISEPYINDFVTARVQIKNTLGSYLEGQDCSVSVYEANTSNLVHDYDTLCTIGEPYVDDSGNWVSPTKCKFSDSMGWYFFKGEIKESMGFKYNAWYDLLFVCNGKSEVVTFRPQLDRQPDIDKLEDFAQKQAGYIVLFLFLGCIAIVFILLLWLIFKNKGKRNKK